MTKNKIAFITGIAGQDGSYLAEFLIKKGYEVHGMVRKKSQILNNRLDEIFEPLYITDRKLFLHYGDINDVSNMTNLLLKIRPNEIYNLAAQSHVGISFNLPYETGNTNSISLIAILELVRNHLPETKLYQASSSEMFGNQKAPQNENTQFSPISPYAAAKVFAHELCKIYRESYKLFICCGILFNHESPRRGENFVTRKISLAAAKIKLGKQDHLYLGNMDSKRDWGYSPEYVSAMWMMLQKNSPNDYVVATGIQASVEDFARRTFELLDLDFRKYVKYENKYERPLDVTDLRGDFSKAKSEIGWEPRVNWEKLAEIMVMADYNELNDLN